MTSPVSGARLLEDQPGQGLQRLPEVRRRLEGLEEGGLLGPVGLEDGEQHRPLVLEVVVEDRLGQTAGDGDPIHAHAVVPVLRKELAGVPEDLRDLPLPVAGIRASHAA